MFNTIQLLCGEATLTKSEYAKFSKGDTILGDWSAPEVLDTFSFDDKQKALDALAQYKCKYSEGTDLCRITEYALEYFVADEDGEFVSGSDFQIADEDTAAL